MTNLLMDQADVARQVLVDCGLVAGGAGWYTGCRYPRLLSRGWYTGCTPGSCPPPLVAAEGPGGAACPSWCQQLWEQTLVVIYTIANAYMIHTIAVVSYVL